MAECLDEDVDPSVGFLYKTMLERDPRKRRVKPVQKHMLQVDFGGLDDSSDDSDFEVPFNKIGSGESSLGSEDGGGSSSGGSGSESGSDEDEDEEEEEDEKDEMRGLSIADMIERARTKLEVKSKLISEETTASNSSSCRNLKVLICCVCLGDISEEDNEIVECDGCGVSVHEGCYGIGETQSVASTESSASTEPWFCDACRAGIKPHCELCPNTGGIYKETDAGRWVHLVCALYIPGVAFGDVDRLSPVTLFEMPYSKWGARDCCLCEDERFGRSGVVVGCDAGMCRNYFHVTCAQREGLLSEASPDEDIADPFYAYCKQHADKASARSRRQNWLAIQSHYRQQAGQDQQEKLRVERKLNRHRQKYLAARSLRPPHWAGSVPAIPQRAAQTGRIAAHRLGVPKEKLARMLTSSASAVKRLMQKAELLGINTLQHSHPHKGDIRKKWHVAPALSVEFVGYFLDRNIRMKNMKGHLEELLIQRDSLQDQESILRKKYDQLSNEAQTLRDSSSKLREEGEKMWKLLSDIAGKQLSLPEVIRPKKVVRSPRKDTPRSPTSVIIHQCGLCSGTNDQHLLAKCDKCKKYYHLGCLDPPLSRMPKKTKLQGWICSECTRSSDEEVNPNAPRRLRDKIKEPVKWSPLGAMKDKSKDGRKRGIRKKGRRKKKAVVKPGARSKLLNENKFIDKETVDVSSGHESDDISCKVTSGTTPPVKDVQVKVSRTPVKEMFSQEPESHTSVKETPLKETTPVKDLPKDTIIEPKERSKEEKKENKNKKDEKFGKKDQKEEEKDYLEDEETVEDKVPEVVGEKRTPSESMPQVPEESPLEHVKKDVEKAQKKGKGKMKKRVKEVKKEEIERTQPATEEFQEDKEEKEVEIEKLKKTTPKRTSAFDIAQIDADEEIMPMFTRQKPQRTPRTKPEKDMRTECCVCNESGNNSTLVRCDECKLCYHFQCLDPPLKKSPKQRGYAWHCTACDPTEDEDDEEEEEEEDKKVEKKKEKPVKETLLEKDARTESPSRRRAAIQSLMTFKKGSAKSENSTVNPKEPLIVDEEKSWSETLQSKISEENSPVEEKVKPKHKSGEKTKPTRSKVDNMEKKRKADQGTAMPDDGIIKAKISRKTPKSKSDKDSLSTGNVLSKDKVNIAEDASSVSSMEATPVEKRNVPRRKRGSTPAKSCLSEQLPTPPLRSDEDGSLSQPPSKEKTLPGHKRNTTKQNPPAPALPSVELSPFVSQSTKDRLHPSQKRNNTKQKPVKNPCEPQVKEETQPPIKRGRKMQKVGDDRLFTQAKEFAPTTVKDSNVKEKLVEQPDNVVATEILPVPGKSKGSKKKMINDYDITLERNELTPPPAKKTKATKLTAVEDPAVPLKEKVLPTKNMKEILPESLSAYLKVPKPQPHVDSTPATPGKETSNLVQKEESSPHVAQKETPKLKSHIASPTTGEKHTSDKKDTVQDEQSNPKEQQKFKDVAIMDPELTNLNREHDLTTNSLSRTDPGYSPSKIKSHEPKLPAKLAFKAAAGKVDRDFRLSKDSSSDEAESKSMGVDTSKKEASPQLVFWPDVLAATGGKGAAKLLSQVQNKEPGAKLLSSPEKKSLALLSPPPNKDVKKPSHLPKGKGIEMVAARLMSFENKYRNGKSVVGPETSGAGQAEESKGSKSEPEGKVETPSNPVDLLEENTGTIFKPELLGKRAESPGKIKDMSKSKVSKDMSSPKISPPKIKDRLLDEKEENLFVSKSSYKLSPHKSEIDHPINLSIVEPPKPTRLDNATESQPKLGILGLPKLTLSGAERKDFGNKSNLGNEPNLGTDGKLRQSSDSEKNSKSEPHPLFGAKAEPRFPTVRSIFPPRDAKPSKSPGKSLESLLQRLTKKAAAQVSSQKEDREMPVLVPEAPAKKVAPESEPKKSPVGKPEGQLKITSPQEMLDSPPTLEQEVGEKSAAKDTQQSHSKE